jgi:saccharopine dehydrogenase-like NADP-dependent oxidoreductase
MKKILLFGAGKSATVLIDYLLGLALAENWIVTVVDANLELASSKIGHALGGMAVSFDINDAAQRRIHIAEADIVISLLPPTLHALVAQDCVTHRKSLLTASYVDDAMRSLAPAIEEAGILFLCEMGLDPGIDHMSAKKMIDEIQQRGGRITSFLSHCGGLVAPANDDNPWRYKISWNPRNVVLAGKAGAIFRQAGVEKKLAYADLFGEKRAISVPTLEPLCWYPNRDSLGYASLYNLADCPDFIRTTLRYPDFIYGWKNLIDLGLTDETPAFQTDGKSLQAFFREHFERKGFTEWLQQKMSAQLQHSRKILEDLVNLVELQDEVSQESEERVEQFMMVNPGGDLQDVDLEELKTSAASTVAAQMHESKLTLQQLYFLGMDDDTTMIDRGFCSAADVLQFALEKKLALLPGEKDLVVMLHQIGYELDGRHYLVESSFVLEGRDDHHTAMAKTVGLPLGIAARQILNGTIGLTGLQIPLSPAIYEPVLAELEANGVRFEERSKEC